jgi:predicted transposase/invertase (TIGR01784 family)
MSKKTASPHDGLFKSFLTTPETARDFLDIHLPAHLRKVCDLSTLKLQPGSFLEDDLRAYYSDVLYSMKTEHGDGYVYALIEHQSSPDLHMGFRMVRYAIAAMQQHLDAGNKELPLVIPLLFYHGRISPYPYSLNWLDNFAEPAVAKALYTHAFPLIDVTVMDDNEIMQHKRVALLELVQKHIRTRDLQDFIEQLVTLLLIDNITDSQVNTLMEYILQVGETNDLHSLFTTLAKQVPKHEDKLMTIAEQLRQEGLQQGLQQGENKGLLRGRQEGQQEAKSAMARNLLLAGVDKEIIIKTTGFSIDELATLSH